MPIPANAAGNVLAADGFTLAARRNRPGEAEHLAALNN